MSTDMACSYYDNTAGKGEGGKCAAPQGLASTWQDPILDDPGACGEAGHTYQSINNPHMVGEPFNLE